MSETGDQQPAVAGGHLDDVPVDLKFELGVASVPLRSVRSFGAGQIFSLRKGLIDAVDVRFAGDLIGRGDLVIVDGTLAVRVTRVSGA